MGQHYSNPSRAPIATYENAEWAYNHREYLHAATAGQEPFADLRPACMISGAEDLLGQIAQMRAQGYVIHAITLHTYCAVCQGSGRVPKRSRALYAWKVCKACKGHEGPLRSAPYQL